jgi:hypothetical protein
MKPLWLHGQQAQKAPKSRRWVEQLAGTSTDCSRYRHQPRRRDPQYLPVSPASVVRNAKSVLQFVQLVHLFRDLPMYCPLL